MLNYTQARNLAFATVASAVLANCSTTGPLNNARSPDEAVNNIQWGTTIIDIKTGKDFARCVNFGLSGMSCQYALGYHNVAQVVRKGQIVKAGGYEVEWSAPQTVPSEFVVSAQALGTFLMGLGNTLQGIGTITFAVKQQPDNNSTTIVNQGNNTSSANNGGVKVTSTNYNTAEAQAKASAYAKSTAEQQQSQYQQMSQSQKADLTANLKQNMPGFDHLNNKGQPCDQNNKPIVYGGYTSSIEELKNTRPVFAVNNGQVVQQYRIAA